MRETRGRDNDSEVNWGVCLIWTRKPRKVFPLGAIFPLLFSENGRLTVGGESFRYRGEFLSPCFLRLTVSPLYISTIYLNFVVKVERKWRGSLRNSVEFAISKDRNSSGAKFISRRWKVKHRGTGIVELKFIRTDFYWVTRCWNAGDGY